MNVDEILRKDAFRALDQSQREALSNIMTRLRGKSAMDAVPIIMSQQAVFSKGKPISPDEQRAMVAALTESLSPEEQDRLNIILNFFKSR